MRVYVPSLNCPYPWSSGARNLGGQIRGRWGLWPFRAKRPSWSLLYILPWFEAQHPIGFEYEPRGFGHFGLIWDQNLPSFENRVLVRIELRGAIVELARITKLASGFWSCEHCVRFFTFMLTRPQS